MMMRRGEEGEQTEGRGATTSCTHTLSFVTIFAVGCPSIAKVVVIELDATLLELFEQDPTKGILTRAAAFAEVTREDLGEVLTGRGQGRRVRTGVRRRGRP